MPPASAQTLPPASISMHLHNSSLFFFSWSAVGHREKERTRPCPSPRQAVLDINFFYLKRSKQTLAQLYYKLPSPEQTSIKLAHNDILQVKRERERECKTRYKCLVDSLPTGLVLCNTKATMRCSKWKKKVLVDVQRRELDGL